MFPIFHKIRLARNIKYVIGSYPTLFSISRSSIFKRNRTQHWSSVTMLILSNSSIRHLELHFYIIVKMFIYMLHFLNNCFFSFFLFFLIFFFSFLYFITLVQLSLHLPRYYIKHEYFNKQHINIICQIILRENKNKNHYLIKNITPNARKKKLQVWVWVIKKALVVENTFNVVIVVIITNLWYSRILFLPIVNAFKWFFK